MKALIVPGVTDNNKGDQALVWETYRLIKDTNLFDEINIVLSINKNTDYPENVKQTIDKGIKIIPTNILKHPRRNINFQNDYVKDSYRNLFRMIFNGIFDLLSSLLILIVSNKKHLRQIFLPRSYNSLLDIYTEADVVFLKGGGFIHAYGEFYAFYLMWYFLFYIRLANKMKKKVIILPNSFGPFEGFWVKKQVKSVLSKVDLIYCREEVSSKALSELLGYPIKVESDLGFHLKVSSNAEEKVSYYFKKYNIDENDALFGLTLRPWRFPNMSNSKEKYHNYINAIAEAVNFVSKTGRKVVIFNQSIGPNAHEDDRNAIMDLIKLLPNENMITWINEDLPCDILKTMYSKCESFLGTRFHSVIFAITSLVPSIAIAYGGNKGTGIMYDFNLNEYVIPIEKVSGEILCSMLSHLWENNVEIRHLLKIGMNKIESSRQHVLDEIIELIKSKR